MARGAEDVVQTSRKQVTLFVRLSSTHRNFSADAALLRRLRALRAMRSSGVKGTLCVSVKVEHAPADVNDSADKDH